MNTNKMTLGSGSKAKLLAAFAVLAVAFVVLAAVPAVDADETSTVKSITTSDEFTSALTTGGDYIIANDISAVIGDAESSITKDLSIDMNGKTVTLTGGKSITASNCKFEIKSTGEKGILNYTGFTDPTVGVLCVDKSGTLVLDNVVFNTDGSAVFPYGDASKATIRNSEIIAGTYAVGMNNAKTGSNVVTVEIIGSTLTTNGVYGDTKDNTTVMVNANGAKLNIEDSTLTGDRQVLFVRVGTVTVSDSTIVYTDSTSSENKTKYDTVVWGTGNEAPASAVVVGDRNGGYAGAASLTISGGMINAASGKAIYVYSDENTTATLNLGKDSATDVKIGSNVATVKNLAVQGDGTSAELLKFVQGSVVISGTIPASSNVEITAKGEVKLDGVTITGDTGTLTVSTTGTGSEVIAGDLVIPAGVTLNVASGATLTVEGEITGAIANNGTITKAEGGNISGATIVNGSTGTIVNDAQENVNIEGTIKGTTNVYDANQIVTITGDTKLDNGAKLEINGTLIVKEGVTLTLTSGSTLELKSNAILDIQGNIVIEEKNDATDNTKIDVVSGTVNVFGTLDINGTLNIKSGNISVEQDGVVNILEEGEVVLADGASYKFIVKSSGALNITGTIGAMTIDNNGTIAFDSEVVSGNVTINMMNGAVVDVKNITLAKEGTLTIKDGKNTATIGATEAKTDDTPAPAGTVYAVISGISIAENITAAKNPAENVYIMSVSGNVEVAPIYVPSADEGDPESMTSTASITLTGFATDATDKTKKSKLTIAEGLTVGKDVTLANTGTLEITVPVDATKGTVKNTLGTIYVSGNGSIATKAAIDSETGVNASKYTVTGTTASDNTYYYVTLDNALAAAADGTTKDITVLGKQTLAESAELVSGATLNIDGAALVIGSGDNASDVVLTIKSGATVKGAPASIDVKGTVYAEKKTDLKDTVRAALTSGADVYTEELDEKGKAVRDGWAKWTNVATAMNDPEITVVKLTRDLNLTSNLTIPEGKTLDTNGFAVNASKNVVITVEGTLDIGLGSVVTLAMADSTTTDKDASIVVKGSVESVDAFSTSIVKDEGFTVLGAYYDLDGKHFLTTVEKAAAIISTVDEQTITIKGQPADKLTVAGDIAFAGKSAEEPATVVVQLPYVRSATSSTYTYSEIAFSGSVSIDNAKISFTNSTIISGTFTNGSGTVALKGLAGARTTIGSATADGTAVLTVASSLFNISATDKQTFTVTGSVTVDNIDLRSATVNGKMTVKGTSNAIADLTIDAGGEVALAKNAKLETTDGKITVLGLLDASAEGASAKAKIINVGADGETYTTGAAAAVNGDVSFTGYSIVVPGSTVPEKYGGDSFKSTEYYVADAIYVTVYVPAPVDAYKIDMIKASQPNSVFGGWLDADKQNVDDDKIGDAGVDKVYAQFYYNIYNITVNADSAVDNLYIDGNLMTKDYNGFYAEGLVAGAHTFSYTLKNGYSGEGTFKILSEGKSTISGSTLTLAGTPVDGEDAVDIELQLTGFTASGYVDPVTPVTPSEDKDGLTVTDYLLIVLVVLIVIMAVIVAMRLMRS